jgi:hypothetical protein
MAVERGYLRPIGALGGISSRVQRRDRRLNLVRARVARFRWPAARWESRALA